MSIDRLDAPLRMTWCLDGSLAPDRQLLLAERLAEAGLFFLTLSGRPFDSPVFPGILARLSDVGVQLSLVVSPSDLAGQGIAGLPVNEVLVALDPKDPGSWDWKNVATSLQTLAAAGCKVGLQLLPLRSSLMHLPDVFWHAAEFNLDRLSLPNVPIAGLDLGTLDPWLLRAGDLKKFARFWSELSPRPPVPENLVVHDLFLWDILCPGLERDHYSGCQAGNSLAHLSADGTLYPCSSWNQAMGSLFDAKVAEFWQRDVRTAVREEIARHPEGCSGCSAYARCFAGCRGLSRDFSAEGEERKGQDLMCPDLL